MTPGARLAAAIEVFANLESERRPAADALKSWGLAHRFAGSGDRAAIAGLVYDALRRRASSAFIMGADTPRAILLGMLKRERGLDSEAIAKLASGAKYAAAALSDDERQRLDAADLAGAPAYVAGDYPEWLEPHFVRAFGEARAEEGAALASRAPLDLRVNTLKADRDKVAGMLSDLKPEPAAWSPWGLRVRLSADAKSPAIHAEPAFLKGMVEVQDEGSQLAALFSGAKAGEQVVDLCAGAGGKTLALAAMMENKGQIFRHRRRQAAPRADPRPAQALGRAQRASAHAEVGRRRTRRSPGPLRPGADRRALHRHRRLAAQSGRQMAHAARAPWNSGRRSRRTSSTARCRCSRPADELPTLRVRCWTRKTARRYAHSSRATPNLPCGRRPRSPMRWASAPSCSPRRRGCRTKASS